MLTIEFNDIEETILIGDLFEEIGFSENSNSTDETGDSFIKNEWALEVLSLDTYYYVEGFRWTKLEKQLKLIFESSTKDHYDYLQCSPEHIVYQQRPSEWTMVKNLKPGDLIATINGIKKVICILDENLPNERLCDMQVSISHSYFTNQVLSHNSHFLVNLGCNAMREGKNVLHYTFELSETAVAVRYDSNLCDMNSNEVLDSKDSIIKKYSEMKLGRLFIKEYPTSTCTVHMIRNHVEKLSLKGFIPDVILIDYADIMRSSRQYDSLRHELKLIYEELRGLATELQIPIWTASQANRDSSNSEIVGLESMSEAYGKAMVADVILTISRRSHEKSSGQGRLFVAKNRAGRDGLVYPVLIDTSRSVFKVTGDNITMAAAEEEDQTTMKQALRNKWQELQKEDIVNKKLA